MPDTENSTASCGPTPSYRPTPYDTRQHALYTAQSLNLGNVNDLLAAATAIAAFLTGDDVQPIEDKPARTPKVDEPKQEPAAETKPSGFAEDGSEISEIDFKKAVRGWLEGGGDEKELIRIMRVEKISQVEAVQYSRIIGELNDEAAKRNAGSGKSVFDD